MDSGGLDYEAVARRAVADRDERQERGEAVGPLLLVEPDATRCPAAFGALRFRCVLPVGHDRAHHYRGGPK